MGYLMVKHVTKQNKFRYANFTFQMCKGVVIYQEYFNSEPKVIILSEDANFPQSKLYIFSARI
jgi:hypothetical protein